MKIRMLNEMDTQAILDIYKPYVLKGCETFEYNVPSIKEFDLRIKTISHTYPYLVYEENGVILGYAYASMYKERSAYQWDVELSVYVALDAQHQGIGKALYQKLLSILYLQNIYHAYACITYPNEASIALHSKLGFKAVGMFSKSGYKFNEWLDVMWMEKTLRNPIGVPFTFRSIQEIDSQEIQAILTQDR